MYQFRFQIKVMTSGGFQKTSFHCPSAPFHQIEITLPIQTIGLGSEIILPIKNEMEIIQWGNIFVQVQGKDW
jgi:hypothetical protein